MKRRLSSVALIALAPLVLLLVGPAPGEVGGCGGSVDYADPYQFCVDKESWICARRQARGEFMTVDDYNQCVTDAHRVKCMEGRTMWPCSPPPITAQTQACIDALRNQSSLSTPDNAFPECAMSTLCGGASSGLTEEASP